MPANDHQHQNLLILAAQETIPNFAHPEKIQTGYREWHYHKVDFQMVYILKGTVKFEYKGHGEFTFYPGDVIYQPPEIHHREIEHSDDLELIEITSPSEFETIKL